MLLVMNKATEKNLALHNNRIKQLGTNVVAEWKGSKSLIP